jgi:hypothetical protein
LLAARNFLSANLTPLSSLIPSAASGPVSGPWYAIFSLLEQAADADGANATNDDVAIATAATTARTRFFFICSAFPVLVSRDREAERVMGGVRVGQGEVALKNVSVSL